MFRTKNIRAREGTGDEIPVDFPWLFFTGMAKLGFTRRETGHLYFGEWCDLFRCYMRQYNFETRRMLYQVQEEAGETEASLDDI